MEHISIEINKDFGRYKHNFFLGYTLSECFFFFLGGLCCVLIILPLGLLLHIDLFIAGWCGVIPASAIIYIGNHQRNGMSEMEYQKKMYALKKMKKLTYQSEETQESVLEILEEEISMKKAQENDISNTKDDQDGNAYWDCCWNFHDSHDDSSTESETKARGRGKTGSNSYTGIIKRRIRKRTNDKTTRKDNNGTKKAEKRKTK